MNIKNLQKNLQAGKHVIVQSKERDYCIISPFKDSHRNYRHSGQCDFVSIASEFIGDCHGDKLDLFKDHTFIGFYEPEFETFKVGDKVLVSKDAEKWCKKSGLSDIAERKDMQGGIYEVKDISGNIYVRTGHNSNTSYAFPPQALSYPMEEEDEVEKAIKLLVERGKIKDGKILI